MAPRLFVAASLLGLGSAQPGWRLIAQKIGGMPLGTAFFEDGRTGITATSHLVPFPGYDAERSTDGGYTWAKTPDQDGLGVGGLFNSAVSGPTAAVISGDFSIQYSNDTGAHFYEAASGHSGGEIVCVTNAGFAILGMTNTGNCNGFVLSTDAGATWTDFNVADITPGFISIDGWFLDASTWYVMANEYVTAVAAVGEAGAAPVRYRRSPTRKLRWAAPTGAAAGGRRFLERTGRRELQAAAYKTQVLASTDGGSTWTTLWQDAKTAGLGMDCIDSAHCCIVGEDADFAYVHCTQDGFKTVQQTLVDTVDGAALVEVAVAPGGCPANATAAAADAYLAVGGYVTDAGQDPVWYRSCDSGATWAKDAAPGLPVPDLLVTDVDCQAAAPNGTLCTTTLWDGGGLDAQGYVARYFPQ